MVDALLETAVGRALLAFWEDLPLWVVADVALAASLLPTILAWFWGSALLAIVLSLPVTFVVAGMAKALTEPIHKRKPRWRDFLGANYIVAVSVWVLLAMIAGSFLIPVPAPVFVVQCAVAAAALMLAPFVLCVAALWPANLRLTWRNAFVLAVCHPMVSLGLLALAALLGWLVVMSNGVLFLVAPALWVSIAVHSVHEVARLHCMVETEPRA
ncbi:MAG: hypothetical protein Kow00106_26330 [Anaerolineae bacterium]